MESSRFPGKPMIDIMGMPMIGHCYFRAKLSKYIDEVYVATCNKEIYDYIKSVGGNCLYTSNKHNRATERIAEAFEQIKEKNEKYAIAMLQGDEPLVHPNVIEDLLSPIENNTSHVTNLILPISIKDSKNKNFVKVIFNINKDVIYMSRETIPSPSFFNKKIDFFRQLGIIGFNDKSLQEYVNLKPTTTELIESIDMNRFIENDIKIKAVITNYDSDSVDIVEDLEIVKAKMAKDNLYIKYKI